jgi:cell wall-associated NlpC family hydrolase
MFAIVYQFIGLPYTWGGISSFGYDCSGFIQMLFRQMGIMLPRDASQQINFLQFESIIWENRQKGDVLFFGSSEASIKHVGLYLGEDCLIHASVKPIPSLQISSIEEPSLKNRFAYRTIRRLQVNIN